MAKKRKTKHPLRVAGYNGSLQKLAQTILRMRYDKVEKFFEACAMELDRQASEDRKRGREQLACLLREAANIAEEQRLQFHSIFVLCEPYLKNKNRSRK